MDKVWVLVEIGHYKGKLATVRQLGAFSCFGTVNGFVRRTIPKAAVNAVSATQATWTVGDNIELIAEEHTVLT